MKILIISRCPPYPLHLGDRLILWHLAKALQARGYTLDLLALAQFESDWQEIDTYQAFFRHIQLFPEKKRSSLLFAQRLLKPYPQTATAAWQPDLWQAIEKRLREENYDAVQLLGGVQVYEFAHLLRDMHSIITPYESYSLYLKRLLQQNNALSTRITRWITRRFEHFMFSPYQRTVVLSPEDKAELLAINPKLNIDVIPNGIDLEYFAEQALERAPATLLFVGNYEYLPNVDAAMLLAQRLLPEIQRHLPDVKLQLVGNAPPPQMLALQSANIEVTGRVPDIRPYYASATAFICPLRIGAGIKNKLLEALAMRLPIVATPLSIEGIAAEQGKHLLVAEIEQIAATTLELLQNRALQAKLSANSRALIETNYSWERVAESYSLLYEGGKGL